MRELLNDPEVQNIHKRLLKTATPSGTIQLAVHFFGEAREHRERQRLEKRKSEASSHQMMENSEFFNSAGSLVQRATHCATIQLAVYFVVEAKLHQFDGY